MDLLSKLTQFIGYGPVPGGGLPGAQVFFLGIEEAAAAGEANLKCRAEEFEPVEDLLQAHQKLGRRGCFNPFALPASRSPVPTWNTMARIALALANDSEWSRNKRWSWYWRQRLGRHDGETFLLDCFPVPRPSSKHAVAALPDWQPERSWRARCDLLRTFIAASSPRYLIAYGKGPGRRVGELAGEDKLAWTPVAGAQNIEVAKAQSGLVLARTGFFGRVEGRFRSQDVPRLRDAMLILGGGPITLRAY